MLAWIQGSGLLYTQEGAYPNPVWVARVRAGLIGTPTRIHIYAIATSIAAAGDVVALGFEGSSDNATYGPTAVTTSVNGKPFSKPVPLDSSARAASTPGTSASEAASIGSRKLFTASAVVSKISKRRRRVRHPHDARLRSSQWDQLPLRLQQHGLATDRHRR